MHNHFNQYLNVKELILKYKPSHVVECGVLNGKNTVLLKELLDEVGWPVQMTVVTDNEFSCEKVNVIRGLSYQVFSKMPDESIDMCIIDTDHNYWTLTEELRTLDPKLKTNGLVLLHDVSTFYHDTGIAETYANGEAYPREIIEECGKSFGGLGTALVDWLGTHRFGYKLIRYSDESHGAAAIQKVAIKGLSYYKPVDQAKGAVCV